LNRRARDLAYELAAGALRNDLVDVVVDLLGLRERRKQADVVLLEQRLERQLALDQLRVDRPEEVLLLADEELLVLEEDLDAPVRQLEDQHLVNAQPLLCVDEGVLREGLRQAELVVQLLLV